MALPLAAYNGTVKWNAVEVPHASQWSINPASQATTYNTNKTKGKVSRRPGPVDVTGSFNVKSTDGNGPCKVNVIGRLQLYPDGGGQPWDLQNAIILSTPVDVNMETGAIVGLTVNFAFAGKDDATGGSITQPDGTILDSTTFGP